MFFAIESLVNWKRNFEIVPIDHNADCSLIGGTSHFVQEISERAEVFLNRSFGSVTLNNDWLVKYQLASAGIISPHASRPRERRRATEARAEHV